MPHAQGMSESLYIGFESSFKTLPGSVTADKVPVISPNIRPSRNKFTSQALTGSPEPRNTVFGKIGVEGDIRAECSPTSLYPWLKGLYGTPTTGGTSDLYHHRFNLGTMLSMFFESRHADLTKYFVHKGIYIGSGAFQFPTEGIMEATFGFMGATSAVSSGSSIINSTITDRTTLKPLSYLYGRLKRDGSTVAYVKLLTVDVNRRLGKDTAIDETNEIAVIFSEVAEVTGRITALFTEPNLYDDSLLGTELSLEIWVPYGSGQGFMLYLPVVILDPFSRVTNGTGLVTLEGGFTAQTTGSTKAKVFSKFFSNETGLDTLTLVISVDGGGDQTVTFAATDNAPEEVVTVINDGTTGCTASVLRQNGETGAVVVIESDTAGTGTIQVKSASTADTTLGFDNAVHSGLSNVSHEVWLFNKVA
jgi:hypothetical protein